MKIVLSLGFALVSALAASAAAKPADAVIELFLPDSVTKKPRFAAH